ncbi:TonB-dependent receptor [Paracidobacterium acidisoli]|uniref:TonB-dependent receptor n=1 Tax=Paracidobacterium acidisoli TaxID=2303751 RepID=A0A372ITA7_9BACT|nr:TonB-dependent receptor [Paracidobacterium acidisoli]MBT9329574.1 TonB-dependent receptor [Paracidobacterium acidisoli]
MPTIRRKWAACTAGILFCLTLFASTVFAQTSKGMVTGTITDASGAVLKGARINLEPLGKSTLTNERGEYSLTGVAPGHYAFTVEFAGFQPFRKEMDVSAGQTATLDVTLRVNPGSEQVLVFGGGAQDLMQAADQEISSANIVNVMPSSEIVALPNENIADATGRLPGVTLQRNEGQGEYVQVRGLDPRLTNVTVDGVTLASPEVTINQVDLTTIPDNMVESIVVNKTLSANQDADGIAGSVDLVTKTAGARPYFSAESTMGFTPIQNTRYIGKVDTTAGMRFGASQRWGLIGGFEADYNGGGIDNIQPSPDLNPDGSTTPYYDKNTQRVYRMNEDRWGLTSTVDYKMSPQTTFAAHFLLSDFKDFLDKYYYEIGPKAQYYQSNQTRNPAIGTLILDGSHILRNSWIHWGSAVSRSRFENAGGDPRAEWSPSKLLKAYDAANCVYTGTPTSIYRPTWSAGCSFPNSDSDHDNFNPENYILSTYRTTSGQAVSLNLQEWAGMGMNYHLGSHSATFEFGGQFRNNHSFEYAETPQYNYFGPTTGSGAASLVPFQTGFTYDHYYGGTYYMGPVTDWNKLTAYWKANPGDFQLDVPTTREGSDSANFDLINRTTAGYVMNTINWPRFSLQTGLRFEATQVHVHGYYVNPSAGPYGNGTDAPTPIDNGSWGNWVGTTPETTTQSYVVPLPSVQARWMVSSMTAIRAVYSRGISRPNPYDLVPYILDNGAGTSQPRYSIGNPSEQPTHANNYDLLVEQELRPFGVIQAGYFYKQLYDPIVQTYTSCSITGSLCNIPGSDPGDEAQQDINANNASVSGLEFSWKQRLSTLPGALRGLTMMANYAYTNSHTNGIPGRTDSPSLIGTAHHSFNIEPAYTLGRYDVHMGISYNGAYNYAYQWFNDQPNPSNNTAGPANGPLGDNFAYPHLQVDAQAGARVWRGLHVIVNGLNLNNEVFGYYNGQPQYLTQREYYKPTYSFSLRWDSNHEK